MNLSAIKLLILILFSFSVSAEELCEQESYEQFKDLRLIEFNLLPGRVITSKEYNAAPCKTLQVPEYDWWLLNQVDPDHVDQSVKGYHFKNQSPELIQAFSDLVKNMPAKNSSCTTVTCAVDEIWGKELGRKILYVRARYGFNTSELAFQETRRLTSAELDDIIIPLGDLPVPLDKNNNIDRAREKIGRGGNQQLTLALAGVLYKNDPLVAAESTIRLYDRWRNYRSSYDRRYSLFHEFGHNISYKNGQLEGFDEWKRLPICGVSKYGVQDQFEDFAESFVMYRYDGAGLKQKCPGKYAFIKDKAYGGKEFLNESQCN